MSRDDKRIKKWRSAGTLGELYLKEMAEQGLLLEDMTHLKYIFREDERSTCATVSRSWSMRRRTRNGRNMRRMAGRRSAIMMLICLQGMQCG